MAHSHIEQTRKHKRRYPFSYTRKYHIFLFAFKPAFLAACLRVSFQHFCNSSHKTIRCVHIHRMVRLCASNITAFGQVVCVVQVVFTVIQWGSFSHFTIILYESMVDILHQPFLKQFAYKTIIYYLRQWCSTLTHILLIKEIIIIKID